MIPARRVATPPAALLLALAVCQGCADTGTVVPPPPDLTAPVVTVRPSGGTFGEVQFVTIATDEAASILYTLDGSEPREGAAATVSGPSPLFWIRMGQGTTTLRHRARDKAGNLSATGAVTYVVDATVPVISTSGVPAIPVLGEGVVRWRCSKEADYVVELVVAGQDPVPIVEGHTAADTEVATRLSGLAIARSSPPLLRIRVADALGHLSRLERPTELIGPVPVTLLPGAAGCWDLALLPSGALAVATAGAKVVVLDADRLSPTRDQVLGEVPVPGDAVGLAPSPDGARVFVTSQWSSSDGPGLAAFDPSTRQVLGTVAVTGWVPRLGAAVTPDGSRVFFGSYGGPTHFADADPTSATFLQVISTRPTGSEGYYPVATPSGRAAIGDQVLDLRTPFSTSSGSSLGALAGAWSVALSPAGDRLFISDAGLRIVALDATGSFALVASASPGSAVKLAMGPDGTHLLAATAGQLQVWRAADLALEAVVNVVAGADGNISRLVVSPSGDDAWLYVQRYDAPTGCQVVRLPLR